MSILDEIKSNLDSNQSLTPEIKDEILQLIILFHQMFPDVSLETLKSRIKDLKVGKITIYERKGPVVYDAVNNEILLSRKGLEEDYDVRHLMMKGLLGLISSCDNYYGFNKNDSLYALNLGFTEMLANTLVGNDGICDFEEELLATNLISKIIGRDVMLDAYFNNDAETIFKKLLEAEVSWMATMSTEQAMSLLNYSLVSRMTSDKIGYRSDSYPLALQNIIDIFANRVKGGSLTPEEIADFQEHVSLVRVLDNHDAYPSIDKLPYYCQNITKAYTNDYKQSNNKRLGWFLAFSCLIILIMIE